jgi:predicted metalloendopeptidase
LPNFERIKATDVAVPMLQAEEMIKEVREAFKKNLPTLLWMDAETRRAAEEKVSGVKYIVI